MAVEGRVLLSIGGGTLHFDALTAAIGRGVEALQVCCAASIVDGSGLAVAEGEELRTCAVTRCVHVAQPRSTVSTARRSSLRFLSLPLLFAHRNDPMIQARMPFPSFFVTPQLTQPPARLVEC